MKTSIIIPYQRGEAYLRDCLDSLKEQSGKLSSVSDMEILLICDHTQDMELECLTEYKDILSIQVHQLLEKTGVAAARNLGLEMATGDYVYFLDSDDFLLNDTLGELITAAQEREDDIIYGKKYQTWFGRSVYLARKQEESSDDEENEDDRSSADSAQMSAEDGEGEANEKQEEASEDGSGGDEFEETSYDGHSREDVETDDQNEIDKKVAYRILVSKRKGVRNISVLNILFKRSFVEEQCLRFPEEFIYFSDVPFLLEALSKTNRFYKCLSAKYIKRKHNDAINFPSLSQIKDPNRFYEFLDTYYETTRRIQAASELRSLLDKKYISYYTNAYAPKLKRSKNDSWRQENFQLMRELISQVTSDVLREQKGYKRRMLKALLRGDLQASIRIVTLHLGYIKLKKSLKNRKILYKSLYFHYFIKCSVRKNWVLFESFFGKSYSDSPKYIYEYLSKEYPGKYRMIWVIDKNNATIPYKHKKIKRYSLQYYYYLARCGYTVFNGRQPEWAVKRRGNIFLETWHGTPLKKLVFDQDEITSASPKYKEQFYKQSRLWDYLIAPNEFSDETFRRCFMYEKTMLRTGYPRNDILHAPDREEKAKQLRTRLGIPFDKKTILYAPTWRDDEFYGKGQYKFELQLNLEQMQRQLGEDYVVIIRTHYFIADTIDISAQSGFAFNMSKYDDISELYLISDILITDYSSVFFDYANLRRPMLFYTYDLEKYRDVLRGFYLDIENEVPGPLLYTTEEVIDAINNIEKVNREYSQRYDEFYHRFCEWEDGHAAEKVVKSVFGKV